MSSVPGTSARPAGSAQRRLCPAPGQPGGRSREGCCLPGHRRPLSLQEVLRPYGAFWLASAFCAGGVLFTGLCVPETKGKTLEQITAHFEGR